MDLSIFAPKPTHIGAVEYLRAKLEYEASPYALHETLEKAPHTVLVVDVRNREAFESAHIRGAAHIEAADIVKELANLPKDRTIVTYCWDATCSLAPKAALELAQKGFSVQFLQGGIEEWKRKGYSVHKSL